QPDPAVHRPAPLLQWVTAAFVRMTGLLQVRPAFAARPAEYYQRLLRDAAAWEAAAQSAWQAGWELYRQGQYDTAIQRWDAFETRFPQSSLVPQVLYWQARATALAGHDDLALRLYRRLRNDFLEHYYHHLALSSFGHFPHAQTAWASPEAPP